MVFRVKNYAFNKQLANKMSHFFCRFLYIFSLQIMIIVALRMLALQPKLSWCLLGSVGLEQINLFIYDLWLCQTMLHLTVTKLLLGKRLRCQAMGGCITET